MSSRKELIEKGKTVLGIEFGSTRIKAVLIDENHHPIASGDHEWENRLENESGPTALMISGRDSGTVIRNWHLT